MKRIMLAVVVGALSVASAAEAQATFLTLPNDQLIQRALAAVPANAREGAMVVKWSADNNYTTIKEGTGLVCYDHSGGPGERPFAVQCTDLGNLPRVQQNYQIEAQAAGDRDRLRTMLQAAEANGTRVQPVFGSVWRTLSGNDQASAGLHTTVAVPGATQASLGLPESRSPGGAWIMDAGTSTAHIMIPGH